MLVNKYSKYVIFITLMSLFTLAWSEVKKKCAGLVKNLYSTLPLIHIKRAVNMTP